MTPIDLAAIEARVKEATPGPWVPERCYVTYGNGGTVAACGGLSPSRADNANADFIAHAREDIEALAKEVRRLMAENAELRAEIDGNDCERCNPQGTPTHLQEWARRKP